TIGSAGSVELSIDGRPGPSLGRVGVVRRDIPLDPERLVALPAQPEPPRLVAPQPAPPPPRGG
ncbi:MAG: hypothetical protein ACKOUS_11105, partial [Alphaproteobacteria bacterium]